MPSRASRPTVFLDRDGTINTERGSVLSPADLRLLPGAARGLARLRDAGFRLVVLTNQSCVGRGLLTEAGLEAIHDLLRERLARAGATIDAIYACLHHPRFARPPLRRRCRCRKPAPGLLERALRDHPTDVRRSFVVGDAIRDLRLAEGTPLRPILVRTGKGAREARRLGREGLVDVPVVADLEAAAALVLSERSRRPGRRQDVRRSRSPHARGPVEPMGLRPPGARASGPR